MLTQLYSGQTEIDVTRVFHMQYQESTSFLLKLCRAVMLPLREVSKGRVSPRAPSVYII